MPIPTPNLYPAFNIIRLSHVVFGVSDLARSRHFYVDTLGLQVTDEDDSRIYLRAMEERGHHCIVLEKSDRAVVKSLSLKVFDEQELDKAHDWFKDRGHPVEWVERPYQGRTLRTTDCFDVPIELYFKMDRLSPIHQQYALYKGVKPLRIDHFNLFSPNVDTSVDFYNQIGFRVTEYTEDEESGKLWAAWTHRKGGVHDMAFTNGRGPRLHHTAFWVPTPLNIIDLCDLMATTGYVDNIERGPGRHGISNAFFLYILDPDGHRIEIYCSDYQTVDPDLEAIKWDLKDPQRQTLWGAPAPRSWFEHGSEFENLEPVDSQLNATPIVAP
ncbi:3,4-dihydroxyphenylacetate 2,3-dioxygenase [Larsenimonas rhizosphaerae]|uniref:3,4-dihydroxyphenylacetate 2,3-dioxygenase n=1 Tax=Larsenimonas rhizosphaerae TaxID=2944682 RepID=A0AA41ZJW2_9GAMM|nr:3,4-dihydroxyphenylacetate 2,3-dioxygenase [Larsenimonas rhizosphaerae]MCM2131292.1 3,4-dihydroxyphenylacetate 2,3-dioxygenase [Larsenimonas rhizosphaerae]MCX2525348.1 3,4-dihydroxyphenylacetate 2,3-dioxygenase [Larsenimonas rhizosphaerae]